MHDVEALRRLGVRQVLTDLAAVKWRREGDWWVALCPFHDDGHTPNFKVGSQEPGRGRCFSCQVAGDVIELAGRILQTSAIDTMRELSRRYGIPELVGRAPPPTEKRAAKPPALPDAPIRDLYREILSAAPLVNAAIGTAYLDSRGVLAAAVASELVGGVDDSREWYSTMQRTIRDDRLWRAAGCTGFYLFAKVAAPFLIFGLQGDPARPTEITHLHLRAASATPAGPRYSTIGADPPPFVVRRPRSPMTVLCEGPLDALTWARAGFSALGVCGVGTWRASMLELAPAGDLLICPDRDAAGEGAAERWALHAVRAGRTAYRASLPAPFKDANDVLARGGDLGAVLTAVAGSAERVEDEGAPRSDGPEEPSQANGAAHQGGSADASAPSVEEAGEPAGGGARRDPDPAEREEDPSADIDDEVYLAKLRGEEAAQLMRMLTTLRLDSLIELLHWRRTRDDGVTRDALVTPVSTLTSAVIAWFEARGGRFTRDSSGGQYLYFRGKMHVLGKGAREWLGHLFRLSRGTINDADRESRAIIRALELHALAQRDAPAPRPWMHFDRDALRLALHLHDPADTVLQVKAKELRTTRNGAEGLLLLATDDVRRITLPAKPDPAKALALLHRHLVNNLACPPHQRSLAVCWLLSVPFRQILDTKALLFAQGASSAGKSEFGRLGTALYFGADNLVEATAAALWTQGDRQPLIALDNQESAQLQHENLTKYLLLSSTGTKREKMAGGGGTEVVQQRTDALILVTAIEPPELGELINRTLSVTFSFEFHRQGYSAGRELKALQHHRGELIAGLMHLFAHGVLPRLRELSDFLALVPPRHPKSRLGQHLALMALLADACHKVRPDIWRNGQEEMRDWLDGQAAEARLVESGTDPIIEALERLLFSWNRCTLERGEVRRPALHDAPYRCRPLYVLKGGGAVVDDFEDAEDQGENAFIDDKNRFHRVVGVVGSYSDLYADLGRVVQDTRGNNQIGQRYKSVHVFSERFKSANRAITDAGWQRSEWKRRGNDRLYRFVHQPSLQPDQDTAPTEGAARVPDRVPQEGAAHGDF